MQMALIHSEEKVSLIKDELRRIFLFKSILTASFNSELS